MGTARDPNGTRAGVLMRVDVLTAVAHGDLWAASGRANRGGDVVGVAKGGRARAKVKHGPGRAINETRDH